MGNGVRVVLNLVAGNGYKRHPDKWEEILEKENKREK